MGEGRAERLFWVALIELKWGCEYMRAYRDALNATLTRFAVARSVVGVGALAGWVTTNVDPRIWAAAIVLVQVAEAVQRAVPYAARAAGATALSAALDAQFIEARVRWEEIADGSLDEKEIRTEWRRLMTLRHEAGRRALPNGLPRRPRLERLAADEARAYFTRVYPGEGWDA